MRYVILVVEGISFVGRLADSRMPSKLTCMAWSIDLTVNNDLLKELCSLPDWTRGLPQCSLWDDLSILPLIWQQTLCPLPCPTWEVHYEMPLPLRGAHLSHIQNSAYLSLNIIQGLVHNIKNIDLRQRCGLDSTQMNICCSKCNEQWRRYV